MTIKELKDSVLALGFADEIESESSFTACANRALQIICNERPLIAECTIYVPRRTPLIHVKEILHTGGSEDRLDIVGRALSFRAWGSGECLVSDADGERTVRFSGGVSDVRLILNEPTEITFLGEYFFTVCDLVCWQELYSSSEEQIPIYSDAPVIDLRNEVQDFLAFDDMPTSLGKTVAGVRLEDARLSLPRDFYGPLTLRYKRRAHAVSLDDEDVDVDVCEECVTLLQLLTASFMWLDDDEVKSSYYMQIYEKTLASLKRYGSRVSDTSYNDTTRWA